MKNKQVSLSDVSKYYKLYKSDNDRLKEALSFFGKEYYDKFYALRNLNLDIYEGEILGIVGKNGSGKSTLLKIISGILAPSSGDVHVGGKVSALLELGSGLNPDFTGIQNIYFYCTVLGLTKDMIERKVEEIISFADIGRYIDQPLKSYSSGMKARLAFSIATAIEPEILIVDEVLAVGDSLFQRKSYSRMNELFDKGCTVIFVSHDLQSVVQFCNRAILLHDGQIIMDGEPKDITDYYQKLIFKQDDGDAETEEVSRRERGADNICYSSNYYDPSLEQKPKILNNSRMRVDEVFIRNASGEIVNILSCGEDYTLTLKYLRTSSVDGFSFGISFFNTKGLLIAGGRHCLEEIDTSDSGATRVLKLKFKNMFQKGKLFIKIDFRENWNEKLLYEATDICSLKMIVEEDKKFSPVGGMVLPQKLEIE